MTQPDVHTLIIGSGISGMTAGILLAQGTATPSVAILEQHQIPGGLTQVYQRQGLTFPTGVHRLGTLEPGQPLDRYFDFLGIRDRLELEPLDGHCFERYHLGKETYEVPMDARGFRDKLIKEFPDQAQGIQAYFKEMADTAARLPLFDPATPLDPHFSLEQPESLAAFLKRQGIHGRAAAILSANNPLYGLPADQCPAATHFMISHAYLQSSFRINEDKTPLAKVLAQRFTELGGQLRTRCRVTQIHVEDGEARGVTLDSGEGIRARRIIFSGHPAQVTALCPEKAFRPVFRKRLARAQNTTGLFGVALAWEKNNCPVARNDAYIYDSLDVNHHYNPENPRKFGTGAGPIFLSALPGAPENPHLAVTALAGLTPGDMEFMNTLYQHSDKTAYARAKTGLTQAVLTALERVYPEIHAHARVVDTYSPATFERYTLTPGGSAYGIKKTAGQFLETLFSPATRVKNLFLTGQSIGFCGIHGALTASVNLCRHFPGHENLMEEICAATAIKEAP